MLRFAAWLRAVENTLSATGVMALSDFQTVDFKKLHAAGFSPERAAQIAKAVRYYTRPEYNTQRIK